MHVWMMVPKWLYDIILYNIWFDLIWFDEYDHMISMMISVSIDKIFIIWHDTTWYDIIWYKMIWYDVDNVVAMIVTIIVWW